MAVDLGPARREDEGWGERGMLVGGQPVRHGKRVVDRASQRDVAAAAGVARREPGAGAMEVGVGGGGEGRGQARPDEASSATIYMF